jgi:uncharacterized membrane protein YraQ (UPF0718 family)/YHS domain-containing protein
MGSVLSTGGDALRAAFGMLWETLWALVLGFTLSGAVQAFVSRDRMTRVLGGSDAGTLARATFFGIVSSSCSYAAAAMARSLFARGAGLTASLIFMLASTNLVIELGIVLLILLGWQFLAAELAGGLVMIVLLAVVARFLLPPAIVAEARLRVAQPDHAGHDHGHEEGASAGGQARWRTLAGWADAAGYTVGDITMVRRELVIGFGVAGVLSVVVPDSVWGAVFVSGHGWITSVENAIVGPLIAVISFVCSIGNVPLAAALWKGGISFGGVVSFIFADLITLPLLLIYRRYWGWRTTLRILIAFWSVMTAGGLIVEVIFGLTGLLPTARPTEIAVGAVGWDATTILDILALVLLAGLFTLHRLRPRLGGAAAYATDPVCGMQVEMAHAPARAEVDGATVYFCSEHCRDRHVARAAEGAGTAP